MPLELYNMFHLVADSGGVRIDGKISAGISRLLLFCEVCTC